MCKYEAQFINLLCHDLLEQPFYSESPDILCTGRKRLSINSLVPIKILSPYT